MSIFSRIFKIGQAATHQVVEKLESPELMLDQAIRDSAPITSTLRFRKQSTTSWHATPRPAAATRRRPETLR